MTSEDYVLSDAFEPRGLDGFADPQAETLRRLRNWAADQRMREAWGDGDRPTYHYNAETAEAAAHFMTKREAKRLACRSTAALIDAIVVTDEEWISTDVDGTKLSAEDRDRHVAALRELAEELERRGWT